MRPPDLVAVHERNGDRLTLWLEDADPLDIPWTADDVVRAATGLGRLAARRAGTPTPPLPTGDFLTGYRDDQLGTWAVPRLLADATWTHPVFALPEVAELRAEMCTLARRVVDVHARLARLPVLPAHGDATPLNLLRPRTRPTEFVLIDRGTATPAPAGFDVLTLVFPGRGRRGSRRRGAGPAGRRRPRLPRRAGDRGADVPLADLASAVLTAAMLRYPCTTMPMPPLHEPVTEATRARARQRAGFVRMVLDLGRDRGALPA